MTFKASTGSDFVVGQVWGRVGADAYLLDQVRARLDLPETIDAVRKQAQDHPAATVKLIEYTANGPEVIATLHHEVPGLVAITPRGSKQARAAAVTWVLRGGNVYLPALGLYPDTPPLLAPWVQEFLTEFAEFPYGAHDDQVDAAVQLLTEWYVPKLDEETTTIEELAVERVDLSGWDR